MREDQIRAMFRGAPETMSVPELAKILGRHEDTIRGWLDQGAQFGFKIGTRYSVRRDAVIEWLIEQNRDDNTTK